jgi:hypothetical protein
VDGEAETARRLDPFHVERHTSAAFNAIVAVAVERRLPCAHALRAWLAGVWDGTFDGPYLEQPEMFAASVLEHLTATGGTLKDAIVFQVAHDAMFAPDGRKHQQVMVATAWQAALAEIPARESQIATALERHRNTQRDTTRSSSAQLALI